MPRGPSDKQLTVLCSEEERNMARALAEKEGRSVGGWVRFVIRREYERVFGSASAKKARKNPTA